MSIPINPVASNTRYNPQRTPWEILWRWQRRSSCARKSPDFQSHLEAAHVLALGFMGEA